MCGELEPRWPRRRVPGVMCEGLEYSQGSVFWAWGLRD